MNEKNVLILSSYENKNTIFEGNESKQWTDEIISSINSKFLDSKKNINVRMNYMGLSEEVWPEYYNLYKHTFSDTKFDVVITLDGDAFKFLLKYGENLFPNTPVVFSGIYNFDKSIIDNHPCFTGIVKSQDVESTLDTALRLDSNTKQIFVITDNKEEVKCIDELYRDKVKVVVSNDKDIKKVKEKIDSLPEDTIIYFNQKFNDDKGQTIPVQKVSDFLFKDIDKPVYSRYYISLNKESVGGVITDGTELGKEVGMLALKILNGEKACNIPVIEDSSHNYVFNYEKLKKFNIDLKSLPEGSRIVNEPAKSYVISKNMILKIVLIVIFIFILGLIFISFNIIRRKRVEGLLSDSEILLNTLINSTPNIIYFKSHDGKFIEINNTTLEMLKIDKKDYKNNIESSNIPIKAKVLLHEWACKDEKAWEMGAVYRSEEVIIDEREEINKVYEAVRIPIFNDDGTRKGLILLAINITDHKINEENEKIIKELVHYDELKTNFFSNISHELRTPLNLIFSALQVMELKVNIDNHEQKDMKKYINTMRQNCYRLLRLISNLIDITKIDTGHFFMKFQNRDIVNVVEEIVLSVVDYVENKGISIVFDTEIEEKIMSFDPDTMERIILNLLSNAIKFTPDGGTIEVNIYDRGDKINISVKDTGVGIPIEKQDSIFEKFVQVDKSLSRNREGSGIGLSLVKELVVLHNGTIELKSSKGEGSEFIIELPVRMENEEKSTNEINNYISSDNIEKIRIEFSDIYH